MFSGPAWRIQEDTGSFFVRTFVKALYFHIFNLFPKQVIIGSFILVYKELVYGKSFLRQALIGKSQPNGIAQRWQKF